MSREPRNGEQKHALVCRPRTRTEPRTSTRLCRSNDERPSYLQRVLAVPCLLIALPACICVALAVLLTTGGPVLVRERDALGRFRLRFRTHVRTSSGRRCPTRLGIVLTYYNLHVLPQLLEVVAGRSSLQNVCP